MHVLPYLFHCRCYTFFEIVLNNLKLGSRATINLKIQDCFICVIVHASGNAAISQKQETQYDDNKKLNINVTYY